MKKKMTSHSSLYALLPHDAQSREILKMRSSLLANEIKIEENKIQQHGCICVNFGTNDKFGIPYNGVIEVSSRQLITPIPHMPDIVAGITNWRGKIITVINIAKLLWSEREITDSNGKLIIMNNKNILIALLVNEIIESMAFDNKTLEPALPLRGVIKPEYISGINHTSVSIINIDAVFDKIQSDIMNWRSV